MLINHLDRKVKEQIIGLENHYIAAAAQLSRYCGDMKKVVKAGIDEL